MKCYDLKYDSQKFNKSMSANIKVLMQAVAQQPLKLPCETWGLLSNVLCALKLDIYVLLPTIAY